VRKWISKAHRPRTDTVLPEEYNPSEPAHQYPEIPWNVTRGQLKSKPNMGNSTLRLRKAGRYAGCPRKDYMDKTTI